MIDRPYEIADAHTHIFPQKIAEKAAHSIADFYKVNAGDVGTVDILLENGRRLGIRHYLVCSVATTPKQVASINRFIAENCEVHPEFVGFGTIHPGMTETDMITEAVRIKERGLRGVKLHPDIQDFFMDDPHMSPFTACVKKNLNFPFSFTAATHGMTDLPPKGSPMFWTAFLICRLSEPISADTANGKKRMLF